MVLHIVVELTDELMSQLTYTDGGSALLLAHQALDGGLERESDYTGFTARFEDATVESYVVPSL